MIYDSKIDLDRKRAVERINYFLKKGKIFELTEKRERRSLSQNNYMHLIFSWYALDQGETAEYVKQHIFKRQINRDLFETEYVNRMTGEMRVDWKSTKDLDTKQMTIAIDRFRNHASKELGLYIPEPGDMVHLNEIEHQIENYKQFL